MIYSLFRLTPNDPATVRELCSLAQGAKSKVVVRNYLDYAKKFLLEKLTKEEAKQCIDNSGSLGFCMENPIYGSR
jgi:hypothetical protein